MDYCDSIMSDGDCLFCKIIKKEIPARIIFESENSIAFLDIAPATRGHTVVVPKQHFLNLIDMPQEIMGPILQDLQQIAQMVMKKLGINGFNLIQNNFEVAGQVVKHAHFHIIPRYKGDKLPHFRKDPDEATAERIDEVYKKMQ